MYLKYVYMHILMLVEWKRWAVSMHGINYTIMQDAIKMSACLLLDIDGIVGAVR